jgi:hypothetical protein
LLFKCRECRVTNHCAFHNQSSVLLKLLAGSASKPSSPTVIHDYLPCRYCGRMSEDLWTCDCSLFSGIQSSSVSKNTLLRWHKVIALVLVSEVMNSPMLVLHARKIIFIHYLQYWIKGLWELWDRVYLWPGLPECSILTLWLQLQFVLLLRSQV